MSRLFAKPVKPRVDASRLRRHYAREKIEEMLVRGGVVAGQKLTQEDLAKKLGVTRTVVREALFELEGRGLVEALDNRGVVSRVDDQFLLQCFDLREAIEGLVARLCCENFTRVDGRELREMVHAQHAMSVKGRHADAGAADLAFHLRLLEIADHAVLRQTVERTWATRKFLYIPGAHKSTLRGHVAIVDAVESGDGDAAERAAREHVRIGKETMRRALAEGTWRREYLTGSR